MKKIILSTVILMNFFYGFAQTKDPLTTNILGDTYFHTFSIGICYSLEHNIGIPKVSYGLQSNLNSGFYFQMHCATTFGYTLTPGFELGYRTKQLGIGYSMTYYHVPKEAQDYLWSGNINVHSRISNFQPKIGTPLFVIDMDKKFSKVDSDDFPFTLWDKPINIELNYFNNVYNEK